ncbi:MAG: hypothetical protein GF400_08070 [Candidatus Eisenbacteria bacterium]|nr:hypothetical protein [Candidatus Eisenbacteria bacterium]
MAEEKKTKRETEPTLLRDVVYVAFKRKFMLIGLLALGILIIAYGSAGQKPGYEADARIMLSRVRPAYAMPAVSGAVLKRGEVINSEIQIITSNAVSAEVVDRLGMAEGENRARVIENLAGKIKAKALPESDIIDISFRHTDPEWAALIVNTALDAYLDIRARVALNAEAMRYLKEQERVTRAARDSVATEIAKLGAERGDLIQGQSAQANIALKGRLMNERITLTSEIKTFEKEIGAVENWLEGNTDYSHVPSNNLYGMDTIRATYNQLITAKARYADAAAKYTADHPEVKKVQREIGTLERMLRTEVERGLMRQKMRLFELRTELDAVEEQMSILVSQNAELGAVNARRKILEADLKARNDVYKVVLDRAEEYRITAAVDPTIQSVSVISRAQVPATPTPQPVNMKVVVGIFTVVFGVLLVYGLEKGDHTLERREDVHRFLGVKVLASIPERS